MGMGGEQRSLRDRGFCSLKKQNCNIRVFVSFVETICFFTSREIPLVEFEYRVFTGMLGGVATGDSGACCVPCQWSALIYIC